MLDIQCTRSDFQFKEGVSLFRYVLRVMGLTGAETQESWTPPSCIMTTPPPATTQDPDERRDDAYDTLYSVLAPSSSKNSFTPVNAILSRFGA